MPKYRIRLTQEFHIYDTAIWEGEADNRDDAIDRAICSDLDWKKGEPSFSKETYELEELPDAEVQSGPPQGLDDHR